MTWDQLKELLRQNRIFEGLSDADLSALGGIATSMRVQPGEPIVKAGDKADAFFILSEGSVEVSAPKDGERQVLATLGPGQVFGEMAYMFPDAPRIATVMPIVPTEYFRVGYAEFKSLETTAPGAYRAIVTNLTKLADARSWTNPVDLIFQHYITAFSNR